MVISEIEKKGEEEDDGEDEEKEKRKAWLMLPEMLERGRGGGRG